MIDLTTVSAATLLDLELMTDTDSGTAPKDKKENAEKNYKSVCDELVRRGMGVREINKNKVSDFNPWIFRIKNDEDPTMNFELNDWI